MNNRILHINAEKSRESNIREIVRRYDSMPAGFGEHFREMEGNIRFTGQCTDGILNGYPADAPAGRAFLPQGSAGNIAMERQLVRQSTGRRECLHRQTDRLRRPF